MKNIFNFIKLWPLGVLSFLAIFIFVTGAFHFIFWLPFIPMLKLLTTWLMWKVYMVLSLVSIPFYMRDIRKGKVEGMKLDENGYYVSSKKK